MVPEPVPAVVLVSAVGVTPLHIVWSAAIAPAVGVLCTVTVTNAVGADWQATPFNVETVVLLYSVVAAKPEGTSYVAEVAPPIVFHEENGLTELSHM